MKQFLVWLFTRALSLEVNGVRYVPDWTAIGAVGDATVVFVGVAGIWYSIRTVRQQLRLQEEMEAKRLEQDLLLRVMDLSDLTYHAALDFVTDIEMSRLRARRTPAPEFIAVAARKVLEAHRKFATATASVLSVLRRSRPRRFPRGTEDRALAQYDELLQRVLATNAKMLEYVAGDWSQINVTAFQASAGAEAFEVVNLFRRVTGDLLARMYSDDQEWRSFLLGRRAESDANGLQAYAFDDDPPLGTSSR